MSNLKVSILDKMIKAYQNNEVMPLKGHTKITLTNVNTGEQEVIEKDNIVTNAIADIFSKNFNGQAVYSNLLPLRNLYAGVLCFSDVMTENANNYNPPADNVNAMVAHAGDLMNDTASSLRGSPNAGETVVTETSIKYVWDWQTNQGNGTISTVCLCPATLGNMGLKPFNDEFGPISAFGGDTGTGSNTLTESEIIKYPFNISANGKTSTSIYMDGTSFKEITVRHDYFAFGIMRSSRDWQTVSTRTATIRAGSSSGNRVVFDDANYYYVAQAYLNTDTNNYGLKIDKIAKSDFTVTTADIDYPAVTLYTGTIYEDMKGNQRIFGFDGTYLYFPNNAGTGFVKLNITTSSDVTEITGTIDIGMGRNNTASNGRQFIGAIAISDGLILGSNYIINGSKAYPIYHVRQIGCSDSNVGSANDLCLVRMGAAVYGNTRFPYSSIYRVNQNNVLCQMFLSTINVLENPVVKNNAQTMKIEYTISEA